MQEGILSLVEMLQENYYLQEIVLCPALPVPASTLRVSESTRDKPETPTRALPPGFLLSIRGLLPTKSDFSEEVPHLRG